MFCKLVIVLLIIWFVWYTQYDAKPINPFKMFQRGGNFDITGLNVDYYQTDRTGQKGKHLKREVHRGPIHFDWNKGNVLNSGFRDNIRLDFTGYLKAPITGPVQFRTRSDDGIRVYLNDALIIDQWKLQAPTIAIAEPVQMVAGQEYPFKLEWYEHGGGAVLQFEMNTGKDWVVVPGDLFTTEKIPVHGLNLTVYRSDRVGSKGEVVKQEHHAAPIQFNWQEGPVAGTDLRDNVRLDFTGFIKAPETGIMQFRTRSDDGVRVYFNEERVIDQWKLQGPTYAVSSDLRMVKGYTYPFMLEWYEHGGGAVLELEWKAKAAKDWTIVPVSAFRVQPEKPPAEETLVPETKMESETEMPVIEEEEPVENQGMTVTSYHSDKHGAKGELIKTEVHRGPINFDWKEGAVLNTGLKDNVRLEFMGFLKVPIQGPIEFRVRSDDGVRVYYNGKKVIDQWKLQAPTLSESGPVPAQKDTTYPFKVEWYEHGGGATLTMAWRKVGDSEWRVIPASAYRIQTEDEQELVNVVTKQEKKVKKNNAKLDKINRKLDVKGELTEEEHRVVQEMAIKNGAINRLAEETEQALSVKKEEAVAQEEEVAVDEEVARNFRVAAQVSSQEDADIVALTNQISSTRKMVDMHNARLQDLDYQLKHLRNNIETNNALLISIKGKLENSIKTSTQASVKSPQEEQQKAKQVQVTTETIARNCPVCPVYAKAPLNVWAGYGDMVKKSW